MKPAPAALINYLNTVRAADDAQLLMADIFYFRMLDGIELFYTNIDVDVHYNGATYLANSILISGLKYKAAIGLEVDSQQISIAAAATDLADTAPFLQALRNV